tara:strand:+ start:229 stop:468 length:240 start_codon:yes stop_codon:yes gene_type:complete
MAVKSHPNRPTNTEIVTELDLNTIHALKVKQQSIYEQILVLSRSNRGGDHAELREQEIERPEVKDKVRKLFNQMKSIST